MYTATCEWFSYATNGMYKRGVEGPVGCPALLYMTNDRGGYFKSVNHFGNLQGVEALYVIRCVNPVNYEESTFLTRGIR